MLVELPLNVDLAGCAHVKERRCVVDFIHVLHLAGNFFLLIMASSHGTQSLHFSGGACLLVGGLVSVSTPRLVAESVEGGAGRRPRIRARTVEFGKSLPERGMVDMRSLRLLIEATS